ncbi:HAD hydrolase-like protein, partial [Methylobacterium organophilum]|nr:HAD hydrolase-like protein [Methylobacterium organophilum]
MTRRPAAPGPGLVVLDFDGTLADSFAWFCSVLNGVADRYRFRRVEAHEVEELRLQGARAIVAHLGIPRWKLPLIARHMHALAARDAAQIALFPGVPAMTRCRRCRGRPATSPPRTPCSPPQARPNACRRVKPSHRKA